MIGKLLADHLQTGALGEQAAARHLFSNGYRVLARNWQQRGGEIDLIAAQGETVVFVEVKTLTEGAAFDPEERIDEEKQRRLRATAAAYLALFSQPCPSRFDAISVWIDGATKKPVRLRHRQAVFGGA